MSTCCAPSQTSCASWCCQPASDPDAGQWLRLGIAGLIAAQSMVFGLAMNMSPPDDFVRPLIHGILAIAAIAVFLLAGGPVWRESLRALRQGRLCVEQLFLAGIFGAFGGSLVATFTGTGSVYYEIVAILLAIYVFGRVLGDRRRQAAWQAATALEDAFAFCQRLDGNDVAHEVAVREVQPGERIRVRPGEGIALDGRVVRGVAFVRQTALTGEPFPVVVRPGDSVLAGSHVLDEALDIEATVPGTERRLDSLLSRLADARQAPSQWQREADRIVQWFLPTVALLAVGTWASWSLTAGWAVGLFNGLAVLIVACPCALGLATPIAIWSALNALAARGLVAGSGDFVEGLAGVRTVVFDKTGTLSGEELRLIDFAVAEDATFSREELRAAVAAVQSLSSHPIARAFAREQPGGCWDVTDQHTIPGIGIEAKLSRENKDACLALQIGNVDLLGDGDAPVAEAIRGRLMGEQRGEQRDTSHEVFIKANGHLVAMGVLREVLRPSAQTALQRLDQLGISHEVMTGDRAASARALGLPATRSGLTPDDKAELVGDLQKQRGGVLFVGDGINDAAAMAQAQTSIALASGAGVAREAAGAQLFGADLTAVPTALVIARQVRAALRSNLGFAAIYNFIGIGLAVTGWLHPVPAALLMLASSLTVTWRALRLEQKLSDLSDEDADTAWAGLLEMHRRAPVAIADRVPAPLRAVPWQTWGPALLFGASAMLLGSLLAYLGNLAWLPGMLLSTAFIVAGAGIMRFWPSWRDALSWQMFVGMLTLGNLGMLIGWWADAGFGPIIREGVCLCACENSTFGWGIVKPFTWMNVGMILAGLPAMFLVGDRTIAPLSSMLTRWRHALWMTAGMLVGMHAATLTLANVPLADPRAHFYLTFTAMALGMMLGMYAACTLWRVATRAVSASMTRRQGRLSAS